MVSLFITSRNSIPRTREEILGQGVDRKYEIERQNLTKAIECVEKELLVRGFTVTRTQNGAEHLIRARRDFQSFRDLPNLIGFFSPIISLRIDSIILESDVAVKKLSFRYYRETNGNFYIQESQEPEKNNWRLVLSKVHGYFESQAALNKLQETVEQFLLELEMFRLASQIVGLAKDFENGKNPKAIQGVINKAERIKSFSQGDFYKQWRVAAE